eukprot:CAMPEP_0195509746 /NCGR_PEP_ID=MMETSP0794_2-20130614/2597_1 /TAXON_ID=515487 /ORGANISM="Stephanopyxis turris, Strain CCMP 815" /LENGTH=260 /DNA_ID=CAMNT_0040637039 /DNA_START=232 /DNA_END=1011 /DNA_ORIENTATION=+
MRMHSGGVGTAVSNEHSSEGDAVRANVRTGGENIKVTVHDEKCDKPKRVSPIKSFRNNLTCGIQDGFRGDLGTPKCACRKALIHNIEFMDAIHQTPFSISSPHSHRHYCSRRDVMIVAFPGRIHDTCKIFLQSLMNFNRRKNCSSGTLCIDHENSAHNLSGWTSPEISQDALEGNNDVTQYRSVERVHSVLKSVQFIFIGHGTTCEFINFRDVIQKSLLVNADDNDNDNSENMTDWIRFVNDPDSKMCHQLGLTMPGCYW